MRKPCLLVAPPNTGNILPRGICELGSFLKDRGCPVELLPLSSCMGESDGGKDPARFRREVGSALSSAIAEVRPRVVGVSCQCTAHYPDCITILEVCKEIDAKVITVIGGPHVTFLDGECVESPHVDVVVRGEGERTLLELVAAVAGGADLRGVRGITFKADGRTVRTPDRPFCDLRELPPVDFGLLPGGYLSRAYIYGMLSRGCQYNCAFCSERGFWGRRRTFPPGRVVEEMRLLRSGYKTDMRSLDDDTLEIGSPVFNELCSALEKSRVALHPDFCIQSRVGSTTRGGVEALRRLRVSRVVLGVESGSEKVLKAMNKMISFEQVVDECKVLHEMGVGVSTYWIVGHPGDSPAEAGKSLQRMKHLLSRGLSDHADISMFIPLPGTRFFDNPGRFGIEILTRDWRRWRSDTGRPVCRLKGFSAGEISRSFRRMLDAYRRHLSIGKSLGLPPG